MYCNLFDPVRNTHLDHIQTEGIFFKALLNRHSPTLSLNLLVDSVPIMTMAQENEEFLYFVNKGVIRAGLFPGHSGIMDYLKNNLVPQEPNNESLYLFSSLPFLKSDYAPDQIRSIYREMWRSLTDECNYITSDLVPNPNHRELIAQSLRTITMLSKNLEGHYLPPRANAHNPILSQRIDRFVAQLLQHDPQAAVPRGISRLQECFRQERVKLGINPDGSQDMKTERLFYKRSKMYDVLEQLTRGDKEACAEAKAIVDLCYNESVASSLQDNEQDLIVNTTCSTSMDRYIQADGASVHRQSVSAADALNAYPEQLFTWEITKAVYDDACRRCARPEDWNETVARCCEEYGLSSFIPGITSGRQPISFYSTVLRSAQQTGFAIYDDESARKYLETSAGCPWTLHTNDPASCDPNPSEPNDHRDTTVSLMEDYAQRGN